ncbi:MAG: asparagine synthetase A [archaeon]
MYFFVFFPLFSGFYLNTSSDAFISGDAMHETIKHLMKPELRQIMKIQSAALKSVDSFLYSMGLLHLMPVVLSPVTDPLSHSVYDSSVDYLGQKLQLTKSMILHKQLALMADSVPGIYIVSPNVRLEFSDKALTGRHLIEFSQVDIELSGASSRQFMDFTEELFAYVFSFVKQECSKELSELGRDIPLSAKPFKVFDSVKLLDKFGEDFEQIVSEKEKQPFWITDYYREFYDRQDKKTGKHFNYDLVYPEGFGEALSGGEREFEFDVIKKKLAERKTEFSSLAPYLEIAEKGLLKPTAGGGFGVERLVRFLSGKQHIRDVTLFPRIPGEKIVI